MKRTNKQIQEDIKRGAKVCGKCGKDKELGDYYPHNTTLDGKKSTCSQCENEIRAVWIKNNPDKCRIVYRRRHLKQRYNISLGQYEEMLAAQGGKCAICGGVNTGKRSTFNLAVDHDHKTGEVRALLCNHCNRGLGFLKDDTTILERALEYLKEFNKGDKDVLS